MRCLLALFSLIIFCPPAGASGEYGSVPELFFKEFAMQNYRDSMDVLLKNQDPNPSVGDTDEQLKQSLTSTISTLGDFEYKELVYKKEVGTRFVVLKYVIGMSKQPVMFRLNLYKPKDRWLVKGFNFNSNFDQAVNDLADEKI